MNLMLFLTIIFFAQITSFCAHAESVPAQLIGKVSVRNSTKLDTKGKKELLSIVDKIKENGSNGAVIITGDAPLAKNGHDYITQSVFRARVVEMHLKALLPVSHQFFVTATRLTGEKKSRQSSVIIYLYPHELMVLDDDSAYFQESPQDVLKKSATVSAQPLKSSAPRPAQSTALTPPAAEDETIAVSSKKQRLKERVEDPVRADELVRRVKARAAARAKQLDQKQ